MKSVRIAELKDNLSRYLRAVEAGDEVQVTDRGRPIARLVPVSAKPSIVKGTRVFAEVRGIRHARSTGATDIAAVLLEERRER